MGGSLPVLRPCHLRGDQAAVKLLTEGLCAELLETNVGVWVIFPGAIGTDIAAAHSGIDMDAGGDSDQDRRFPTTSPEDAARIILDGIEDGQFHIYVGRDARMMNLINRAAPRRSTHMIYRQMKDLLSS